VIPRKPSLERVQCVHHQLVFYPTTESAAFTMERSRLSMPSLIPENTIFVPDSDRSEKCHHCC
jgi:hypothetical protein